MQKSPLDRLIDQPVGPILPSNVRKYKYKTIRCPVPKPRKILSDHPYAVTDIRLHRLCHRVAASSSSLCNWSTYGNFLHRLLPPQPVRGNFSAGILQGRDAHFPHQEPQDLPQASGMPLGCSEFFSMAPLTRGNHSTEVPCVFFEAPFEMYRLSSLRPLW